MIDELRSEGPVLVVDAGGSLGPPRRGTAAGEAEQRLAKAELIAATWRLGGIDGAALGRQDWELGAAEVMRLALDLPVLAANLTCGGDAPFPATRIVERDGRRIGLAGLTEGAVPGCEVAPPADVLAGALEQLADVDVTVLLSPFDPRKLGPTGFDLVVDGHSGRTRAAPEAVDGSLVVSSGNRTKHLGVARITWAPGATGLAAVGAAERLAEDVERLEERAGQARDRMDGADEAGRKRLEAQVRHYESAVQTARARLEEATAAEGGVSGHALLAEDRPLSKEVADHAATAALVVAALDALPAAEAARPTGPRRVLGAQSPYAGADACAGCHPAQQAQWGSTGHARAWRALVDDHRAGDIECFACHATGVGAKGGPTSPATVGPLRDVQCESCHGPAADHARDPENAPSPVRSPELAVCTACHDGERDGGRFDAPTYLPKVAH